MTQAKLEEIRDLMEIPLMQDVIKDMEKEWLEKGEANAQQKIAKNLLKAKINKKVIAEVTGLSLEEINKIKTK